MGSWAAGSPGSGGGFTVSCALRLSAYAGGLMEPIPARSDSGKTTPLEIVVVDEPITPITEDSDAATPH